jgi:hypothetical protein
MKRFIILSTLVLLMSILFVQTSTTETVHAQQDNSTCRVEDNSISFNPYHGDVEASDIFQKNPDGSIKAKTLLTVKMKLLDCKPDKLLEFRIFEDDDQRAYYSTLDDDNGPGMTVKIYPPADGNLEIRWWPGTYGCDNYGDGNSNGCEYEVAMLNPESMVLWHSDLESQNDSDHYIDFTCPEIALASGLPPNSSCPETVDWRFDSTNGILGLSPETTSVTPSGPCAKMNPDTKKMEWDPNCYEFISDFPFTDDVGNLINKIEGPTTIGGFLNSLFQAVIGIAGVLAVIMIIYHAWTYLTSENITEKVLLKEKLLKVLLGLVLLLGAYVILRTINPNLLNLEPNIKNIELSTAGEDGSIPTGKGANPGKTYTQNDACPGQSATQPNETCVLIPDSINVKPGAGKYSEKDLVARLSQLKTALTSKGITEWRITEAWKPTVTHISSCHPLGTCVDINYTGNIQSTYPTAEQIKKVTEAADSVGLCAIYEVFGKDQKTIGGNTYKGEGLFNYYISQGLKSSKDGKKNDHLIYIPTHPNSSATAHFSVYNHSCPKP